MSAPSNLTTFEAGESIFVTQSSTGR